MEITLRNRLLGGGLVALAAVLWSLDGVFFRPQLYSVDVLVVVFIEHFIGFLILCPFIFLYFREIKQLNRKDWLSLLWVSVMGGLIGTYAITQAFFSAFAGATSIAAVIIIQKLQPIFAILLSRIILKERLDKKFYLWASLAILASYSLVFNKNFSLSSFLEIDIINSAGFMALIAAFAFGSSTVLGKRLVNHLQFGSSAALRLGTTAILSMLLLMVFRKTGLIWEIDKELWKLFLIIAVMTGAAATTLYYKGLKQITASLATLLELFWPISAIILDFLVNHNLLSPIQLIATVFLLVFVYKAVKTGQPELPAFTAQVIDGEKVGKKMGFPTFNLDKHDLEMAHGIYLVDIQILDRKFKALMHYGPRKTFQSEISTEIYIDEHLETIPKEIKVSPIKRIRKIKKFKTKEELKKAIENDVKYLQKN